jgi:hypothetical protein
MKILLILLVPIVITIIFLQLNEKELKFIEHRVSSDHQARSLLRNCNKVLKGNATVTYDISGQSSTWIISCEWYEK